MSTQTTGAGGRGLFIVFEGGDGAGKSTQVRRLDGWLRAQGCSVVLTREPGDSPVGNKIRDLVLDPGNTELAPRTEALLYAADKAQHVHQVVLPALRAGSVVVCDRYVDSMLSYQGAGRVLSVDEVGTIAHWATQGLLPDLTVVLDASPGDGVGAKQQRDRLEAEPDDFHDRVRQGFLDLAAADPHRYLVLPARDTREQIERAVREAVRPLLRGLTELSDADGRVEP